MLNKIAIAALATPTASRNLQEISSMTIYRKIWKENFGTIPKDEFGRSYEIHHIDGNRNNNNITNLKCVSIQEHYDIHFSQGDYGACAKIAQRMKMPLEILSELASKHNTARVKNKTNPFLGPEINRIRIENGTHHLVGGKLQRKQVLEGTHNFVKNNPAEKQLREGNHPSQVEWHCQYCNKIGKNLGSYARFHGDKCKKKKGGPKPA